MDYRDLPYDAEIEYLQSADSSSQWIDTGIQADSSTTSVYLDISFSGSYRNSNGGNIFIGSDASNVFSCNFGGNSQPKSIYAWFGKPYASGGQIRKINGVTLTRGIMSYNNSVFSYGGKSVTTEVVAGKRNANLHILENFKAYSIARLYGGEIKENGVTIMDLIPVRVGTVGYLYDRISKNLLANGGTDPFIAGPDVAPGRYANEVAFLESWGNQYIDTGIKPSTDTKIELKCLYCKSGAGLTNYGSLIGADDRSNAYILNHSAVANFTYGTEFSNNFANPQTRLLTFDSTAAPQKLRVYDEGGSLVTTLTCMRGVFEVNQNLYLFATNRSGTPVYGSNRILYCKIYDGDTLVRDYVPVEYNGIGYMYDKVSGLFFDNQGTGKFLFGSIAKACARSYTRRQLMAKAPVPWRNQYLTFTALQTGTFKLTTNAVEYSLDGGSTWTTLAANTNSPTVNAGETIMWRGTLSPASNVGVGTFSATGNFEAKGNPASLLFGSAFLGKKSLSGKNYAFYNLFRSNTKLKDISDMYLVATTLSESCYYAMFYGCTALIHGITELPATIVAAFCYNSMFEGCSSMISIPSILPAPTVNNYAYFRMFYGCSAITVAPEISASTVRTYSLANMFMYCTNLTTPPPVLNITSFGGDRSCGDMFDGCTKLASAPELPATTLRTDCYSNMFRSCTSLVTAPVLPATTLATRCYQSMFNGCSKLAYVKAMFTTTPGSSYTNTWLNGVASSGTFVKNSAATWNVRGASGIPNNWTIETADK